MMQIIFNEISAAEMAAMPVDLQLELLAAFQNLPEDLEQIDKSRFGQLHRDGKTLYRHHAKDFRLYFEISDAGLIIHRVLHKNTIRDFLFRTDLPMPKDEDDAVGNTHQFWELIDAGRNAAKK